MAREDRKPLGHGHAPNVKSRTVRLFVKVHNPLDTRERCARATRPIRRQRISGNSCRVADDNLLTSNNQTRDISRGVVADNSGGSRCVAWLALLVCFCACPRSRQQRSHHACFAQSCSRRCVLAVPAPLRASLEECLSFFGVCWARLALLAGGRAAGNMASSRGRAAVVSGWCSHAAVARKRWRAFPCRAGLALSANVPPAQMAEEKYDGSDDEEETGELDADEAVTRCVTVRPGRHH